MNHFAVRAVTNFQIHTNATGCVEPRDMRGERGIVLCADSEDMSRFLEEGLHERDAAAGSEIVARQARRVSPPGFLWNSVAAAAGVPPQRVTMIAGSATVTDDDCGLVADSGWNHMRPR